jgi:HK97 family phage major capsid protein
MRKMSMYAGAVALGAMSAAERAKGRYMRDPTGHKLQFKGTTPAEIATEVKTAIEDVWRVAEEAKTNIKNLGDLTNETKAKADEALTKFNVLDELKVRMDAVEQKNDRPGGPGHAEPSYGKQVAESTEFKAYMDRGAQGSVRLGLKAITSAAGQAGGLIVSQRETEVVGLPQRPDIVMRDLLTVMPINTSSVDYPKQTVRNNAAAPVAEGNAKP